MTRAELAFNIFFWATVLPLAPIWAAVFSWQAGVEYQEAVRSYNS